MPTRDGDEYEVIHSFGARPAPSKFLRMGHVEKKSTFLRQWRHRRLSLWPSGLDWKFVSAGDEEECGVLFFDPGTFKSARAVPSGGQSGHKFEVVADKNKKLGKNQTLFRVPSAIEAGQWVQDINSAAKEAEEKVRTAEWCFVKLHIYHVHHSSRVRMLNKVTKDLLQVGGVFHTGLEVYGREYSYGSLPAGASPDDSSTGIFSCDPRRCTMHTYLRTVCLGLAQMSKDDFLALIREPAPAWQANKYHILTRNCVTFCRMLAERLCPGGDEFPAWVDSLAQAGGLVASGFKRVAVEDEAWPRGVSAPNVQADRGVSAPNMQAEHGPVDQELDQESDRQFDAWQRGVSAPAWQAEHEQVDQQLSRESFTLTRRASSTIALFVAAEEGQNDVVEACIADGAPPDSIDDRGRTPLMAAASRDEVATCRALLDARADAGASSIQGLTPLMAAAQGGHAQVVQLLLERRAPVSAVDSDGRTALARAAAAGCEEALQLLVKAVGNQNSEFIARTLSTDAASMVRAAMLVPCEHCESTGSVGLFGPIGFGFFTRSCPSCGVRRRGASV